MHETDGFGIHQVSMLRSHGPFWSRGRDYRPLLHHWPLAQLGSVKNRWLAHLLRPCSYFNPRGASKISLVAPEGALSKGNSEEISSEGALMTCIIIYHDTPYIYIYYNIEAA